VVVDTDVRFADVGEVCNYVLSTSSLVCPPLFGLIHRQFPCVFPWPRDIFQCGDLWY